MYIVLFACFAFLGGIVSSLLGWLGTTEPFEPRKFCASALKAFVAALAAAVGGSLIPPVGTLALVLMCITAFLAGVGVDAGLKRGVDAFTK